MAGFEYRSGRRHPIPMPLDSSSADITVGMAVTIAGATDGYIKEVDGSGEAVIGIAMQDVTSPSSDGLATVLVDVSMDSEYEVGPDAGSVTQALLWNTADVGANGTSVNIDASSTDDILITRVDTNNNKIHVQLRPVAYTGVA